MTSLTSMQASLANVITTHPAGTTGYAQFYRYNSTGCGPGTRRASNALSVTVQ